MTCTCGEPLQDQRRICSRCERILSLSLGDMEAHRAELVVALTRQVRMNAPNDGGRSNGLALDWTQMGGRYLDTITAEELKRIVAACPPAKPAADAMHEQRHLLVQWSRLLHEEMQVPLPNRDTIRALSLHIESHMTLLHTHEAAGQLVAEVRDLVAQIIVAIDSPVNRLRVVVGPCPMDMTEEDPCPGQVVAMTRADGRPGMMRCSACRSEWGWLQWHRIGAAIRRREGKPIYNAEAASDFMRGLGVA